MEPAPSVLNFSLFLTSSDSCRVRVCPICGTLEVMFSRLSPVFNIFLSAKVVRSCVPTPTRLSFMCSLVFFFIHLNFTPFPVCLNPLNSRCKSTPRTAACLHILFLSVSVFSFFLFFSQETRSGNNGLISVLQDNSKDLVGH